MISRVAESAFWLTRYLERVEALARMQYVNTNFVLDVNLHDVPRWAPLVTVVGEEKRFSQTVPAAMQDDGEVVQRFLTWDQTNPSSMACALDHARGNARTIREAISLEMWEALNGLWLWFHGKQAQALYQRERYEFYQFVRDGCVTFSGFALDTMLQSEAYNFMRLGASLERADLTARLLDVKYHALGAKGGRIELPSETAQWQAILRFCAAIEPYFKVVHGELSGQRVAEFLLFDKYFPRSVTRSLDRAWNFLSLIRPRGAGATGKRSADALAALRKELAAMTTEQVVKRALHKSITQIVQAVAEVCALVAADFFQAPGNIRRNTSTSRANRARAS